MENKEKTNKYPRSALVNALSVAVLALALLFVPGHIAVGRDISRIALYSLYAVIAGLQTGYAFKKTGGLYNPVLIHITLSAFVALLYYTYAPGVTE